MLALRLGVVMCAFAVHAATVDPDRVLRLLRPIASRSALTATLIARMVPLAAADYARLGEASALRGPGAAPAGRAALARRLVAGSLDRAVDVAATLELRGYARARPARRAARAPLAARSGAPRLGARDRGRLDRGCRTGAGGFRSYPSTWVEAGGADAGARGRAAGARGGSVPGRSAS